MFSTSGYFKKIECPHDEGLSCDRPYCHFYHKTKINGNGKEKVTKLPAQQLVSSNANIAVSSHPQPHGSQTPFQNEDTMESVCDKRVDPTALLQQVLGEAVQKAFMENPILSQSLNSCDLQLDASSILRNVVSNISSDGPSKDSNKYLPPPGIPSYKPTPISQLKNKKESYTPAKQHEYTPTSLAKNMIYMDKMSSNLDEEAEFSPIEDDEQSKADFDILEQVMAERSSAPSRVKAINDKKLKLMKDKSSVPQKSPCKSKIPSKDNYLIVKEKSSDITDKSYEDAFQPPSPVFTSSADIPAYSSGAVMSSHGECNIPEKLCSKSSTQIVKEIKVEAGRTSIPINPVHGEKVSKSKVPQISSHSMLPQISHLSYLPTARTSVPVAKVAPKIQLEFSSVEELLQQFDGRNETGPQPVQNDAKPTEFSVKAEPSVILKVEKVSPVKVVLEHRSNIDKATDKNGLEKFKSSMSEVTDSVDSNSPNKRKYDSIDAIDQSRSRKKSRSKHNSRSRHRKRKKSKDSESDRPRSSSDTESSVERHKRKKHRKYSKHRHFSSKKAKKHRRRRHKRSRHRDSSCRSDKKHDTDQEFDVSPLPVALCDIKVEKNIDAQHKKIVPILASSIKKEGDAKEIPTVQPIVNLKPNPDKKMSPTISTGSPSNVTPNVAIGQATNMSLFDIVLLNLKQEKLDSNIESTLAPGTNCQSTISKESQIILKPNSNQQLSEKVIETNGNLTQSSSDNSFSNSLLIDLEKSSEPQYNTAVKVKPSSSKEHLEQHSQLNKPNYPITCNLPSPRTSRSSNTKNHPVSSAMKNTYSLSPKSIDSNVEKSFHSLSKKSTLSSSAKDAYCSSIKNSLSSVKKISHSSSSSKSLFLSTEISKNNSHSSKKHISSHKSSHSISIKHSSSISSSSKRNISHESSSKDSRSHSSSSKHSRSHSSSVKHSSSHQSSAKHASSHSSFSKHSSSISAVPKSKEIGIKASSRSNLQLGLSGKEKPARKGSSDSSSSKLNLSQDFNDLLNSADTFSTEPVVKKRLTKGESERASKGKKQRRTSLDKHIDRKKTPTCAASPEIGSPMPDLSALDEIDKEAWDQLFSENNVNSSQCNVNSSDEEIGEVDAVDYFSTENPDSTFDCEDDANDPKVIQECYQLFSSYNPDRTKQTNIKVTEKKPTEVKTPEIVPVRHHRNARTGATGNLLGPKPSLKRVVRKTPAQIMLERYQKLKDEEAVLKEKLEEQYSHLERTVGVSQLVSSSYVSSSSLSSPSAPLSSSNSRFGASSDQNGVSSTATGITGKKRIARAPSNVAALMKSKSNLQQFRRPSNDSTGSTSSKRETIETIATTNPKGIKRIAHIPTSNETLERPIIANDGRNKVPQNIRQRYLNTFIEETKKFCETIKLAYDIAVAEEINCHDRASTRMIYLNLAVNTLKKLRNKQLSNAAQQVMDHNDSFEMSDSKEDSVSVIKKFTHPVNPNHKTMSHYSVMTCGGQKGSWSIEKNKKNTVVAADSAISGVNFYKHLKKYILSHEELDKNGYPSRDAKEKGKAVIKNTNFRKKVNPSQYERICARCSTRYTVDDYGIPTIAQTCVYHWGRPHKTRGRSGFETRYSCCQSDNSTDGCCLGDVHVSDNFNPDCLRGFVRTFTKDNAQPEVFALDCEMCYTTEGNELTRITVINSKRETVYESLVLPDNPIIDYNTRFSGITAEDMKDVTVSLRDVQAALLTKFSTRTILMGHSLESDFMALKLLHHRVVDTSIVFPHKLGPPYKRALKNLASELLSKLIQNDVGGHDSAEDAITCIELMQYKVKEDLKLGGLN